MTARPGHPRNRALRRALAARRMERAREIARARARRVLARRDGDGCWTECEACGRPVLDSGESGVRGAVRSYWTAAGVVRHCRECQRHGVTDALAYLPGGIGGTLAGPEWTLPGGERAALLGTVALARSLGGAQ